MFNVIRTLRVRIMPPDTENMTHTGGNISNPFTLQHGTEMEHIGIDSIIRSHRKTFTLEVSDDAKLTIRAPHRATLEEIQNLVRRKRAWIIKTRQRVLERRRTLQSKHFREGEKFLFLGKAYPIHFQPGVRTPLIFRENKFILNKESGQNTRELFIKWYKQQARKIIGQKANTLAQQKGFRFTKVRITSAEKRWGSCSQGASLNFSWRLILAPTEIIDYVILHELSHLRHQNHSRKFWDTVASVCPEYPNRRKWLKENGYTLSL